MSLRCVITSQAHGVETEKTAEIGGTGKAYLTSLSQSLSAMQGEVNQALTELVEKEKGQGQGAASKGTSDRPSDGKGTALKVVRPSRCEISQIYKLFHGNGCIIGHTDMEDACDDEDRDETPSPKRLRT